MMLFSRLNAGLMLALCCSFVSSSGVQFAGINIAGFDFGCSTDGSCVQSNVQGPLGTNGGGDGPGQMTHFAQADKFNMFRLPVGWQYLQSDLGAPLNADNLNTYDQLVQACLKTNAHCIIDIHNYARWNGNIIGQSGGPTNDQFANLWEQLAKKYASEANVVMGLMNEPHDLPDVNAWAQAVQGAVTAIRSAGATQQMILLPGNDYTAAGSFVSSGSAAAMNGVKDSDGTTSKLIFDVHNYFDSDGSGTNPECTSNKIADGFQPLVSFLQANNRMALVTELGGGSSTQSCLTDICQALDFLNTNSDVYLGWVGWAAGSFQSSYPLSLLPQGSTDVPLVSQCFAAKFNGNGTTSIGNSTASPVSTGNSTDLSQPGPGTGSSGQAPPASVVQPPFPSSSAGTPSIPFSTGTVQSSNSSSGLSQPPQSNNGSGTSQPPESNSGSGTSQPSQSSAAAAASECKASKMKRRMKRKQRKSLKRKMTQAKLENQRKI